MPVSVIWIDQDHAKIFHFSNEKMERINLQSKHHDHHTHRIDQIDKQRHERLFFSEAATQLMETSRILILGPGVAKHQFQTYLTEQHPILAKKTVGCETVDHPTDPEIAALARKFFNMPSVSA